MVARCEDAEVLHATVTELGSPLHVHRPQPLVRNARALEAVATQRGVELRLLFARKANKALCYVDAARDAGLGIDTASDVEVAQSLDAGVDPGLVVCTAAIKEAHLLDRCVAAGVTIVVDNADELAAVRASARRLGHRARCGLRVSGFTVDGVALWSRFGTDVTQVVDLTATVAPDDADLVIEGLHTHLDGYSAAHRSAAAHQLVGLVDALRTRGHPITWIDLGGGLPVRYVDDHAAWDAFWVAVRASLTGDGPQVTHRGHGLGLELRDGEVVGAPAMYPFADHPHAADWLADVLDAGGPEGQTVAAALTTRGLELRLEPGRSLLHGCGMTVARVVHRTLHIDGTWLIGIAMNRTQSRTSSVDLPVDWLWLPAPGAQRTPPIEGVVTGAYCTESEVLTLRRLRWPDGVAVGDLAVVPNTAGYFMHFLESRSHQLPLARNVVDTDGALVPDRIDSI